MTGRTGALGSRPPPARPRALRKGLEDGKNEPGAADFYYGEMEMRRFAKRDEARRHRRAGHLGAWVGAGSEYLLLWLYWLVSGYGLRASRALAAMAVVVTLGALAFLLWGFPAPAAPDFHDALRLSVQAATSLLRGSEKPLTPVGEWVELALRLAGPVLLGLALLSLRGRVKR